METCSSRVYRYIEDALNALNAENVRNAVWRKPENFLQKQNGTLPSEKDKRTVAAGNVWKEIKTSKTALHASNGCLILISVLECGGKVQKHVSA